LLNVWRKPLEPFDPHEASRRSILADPLQRMRAVIEIARINPTRSMGERGAEPRRVGRSKTTNPREILYLQA
jgi:hypothetical protein